MADDQIKPGDKVVISNPASDFYGRGSFEVDSVDPATDIVTIKTKQGNRKYKTSSLKRIKPLPTRPTTFSPTSPSSVKPDLDEFQKQVDFFRPRKPPASNLCPECGQRAIILAREIRCRTRNCLNNRP